MRSTRRRGSGGGLLEEAQELLATRGAASLPARVPPWLGRGAARHPGIGRFVDHTLLAPEAQRDQIAALCDEAIGWGLKAVCGIGGELKAVCVNGGWVRRAADLLAGSPVLLATVVGFPLGVTASAAKAAEA